MFLPHGGALRNVSALHSTKHICTMQQQTEQKSELLTLEPKKKRHIMLLMRCCGSTWLKAFVSSVCNLPLLTFSSEICSLQQQSTKSQFISHSATGEIQARVLGLIITNHEMFPHEIRISLLPEHEDGHISHHERQHRPVR